MRSFPLTFAGGVLIGVTQSLMSRYVTTPGAIDAVPFVIIIIVLMLSGERFAPRTARITRFAAVGSGRINWPVLGAAALAVVAYAWLMAPKTWVDALIFSAGWAIILLSLVVVTGFAGQLSLAQVALAGVGAWAAGRLADGAGVPMVLALLVAVVVAIPVGLVLGFPAIRTRGVNLAVITLGFAVTVEAMIFNNPNLTGGVNGTRLPEFKVFGVSLDVIRYPERYFTFALVVLLIAVVVIANVRRGRPGRSMLAVRANERAAASMGISVVTAKLYAFALGSAVAAAGGVVLSYRSNSPVYYEFSSGLSINAVANGTIGGIAWIAGAPFGSQLLPGSVFARLVGQLFTGIERWLPLIGGVGLILMLLQAPDGLAKFNVDEFRRLRRRLRPSRKRRAARRVVDIPTDTTQVPVRIAPCTFAVTDLSVRFGGVEALSSVSIDARSGEIVGLIGPNGAGKSTLIEAVTGFVVPTTGDVVFDGRSLKGRSPSRRARSGIGRSFQSLELFEDMTVEDNLRTACDSRGTGAYFADVFWPRSSPLTRGAWAAVREFNLAAVLDRMPTDLPYAQRRLVAIARAIAPEPSLLLLDEPAAGLDATESKELGALLRRLASEWGMAIVLVEHDIDLVMQVCDRIVVLEFGSVIASGTPSEIQEHPEVIRAYLGATEDEDIEDAALPTPIGNPR
jgi:sulfate-transporting ATPase